ERALGRLEAHAERVRGRRLVVRVPGIEQRVAHGGLRGGLARGRFGGLVAAALGGAAAGGEEDHGGRGDAGAGAAGGRGSGGLRDGSGGPETRGLHHGVVWVGV